MNGIKLPVKGVDHLFSELADKQRRALKVLAPDKIPFFLLITGTLLLGKEKPSRGFNLAAL